MSRRRGVVLAFVAVLATGCGESPVAPSGPVGPAEVTVTAWPLGTVPVGSQVSFQFHLSRRLDFGVDIWTEVRRPNRRGWSGQDNVPTTHIRAGSVQSNTVATGIPITPEDRIDRVGDWRLRIMGDLLPEGVVLGEPSEVAWTFVP